MEDPDLWNNPDEAQALGQERNGLSEVVHGLDNLEKEVSDGVELLELAEMEEDEEILHEVTNEARRIVEAIEKMEFRRMFSGEADRASAFIDIQAGSGGTGYFACIRGGAKPRGTSWIL